MLQSQYLTQMNQTPPLSEKGGVIQSMVNQTQQQRLLQVSHRLLVNRGGGR
jgi:hypothetical protein